MVKIKWLKSAKEDLKEIFFYISKDSKSYAKHQIEKIILKTELLKTNIKIGKKVAEMNNENIRELIEGNYRIIYNIKNDKLIHIILIHHGARDLYKRID